MYKSYYCKPVRACKQSHLKIIALPDAFKKLLHVFDARSVALSVLSFRFDYPAAEKDVVAYYERVFSAYLFGSVKEFPVMALCRVYEYESEFFGLISA